MTPGSFGLLGVIVPLALAGPFDPPTPTPCCGVDIMGMKQRVISGDQFSEQIARELLVLDELVGVCEDLIYTHWNSFRRLTSVSNRGPQGEPGEPGEDAELKGPRGPKGDQGPEGPAGPKGDKGREGPEGPAGPKGGRGMKGEPGEPGMDGGVGDQGEKGPKGWPGLNGKNGVDGVPGIPGDQGIDGEGCQNEPPCNDPWPGKTWDELEWFNCVDDQLVISEVQCEELDGRPLPYPIKLTDPHNIRIEMNNVGQTLTNLIVDISVYQYLGEHGCRWERHLFDQFIEPIDVCAAFDICPVPKGPTVLTMPQNYPIPPEVLAEYFNDDSAFRVKYTLWSWIGNEYKQVGCLDTRFRIDLSDVVPFV